ncbi:MAG: response regulator [Thermodesulfobacteriota bacterium]
MVDVRTPPVDSDATPKGPTSVLIVDDSPVMRNMLAKFFTDNGFQVVGMAADGLEAINLFEKLNPDLMTLDIIMPKMRGTEVLENILERYPEAKIVMASSVSDARTVMKCLKIGAKQYILKPYDQERVMAAIKKALNM